MNCFLSSLKHAGQAELVWNAVPGSSLWGAEGGWEGQRAPRPHHLAYPHHSKALASKQNLLCPSWVPIGVRIKSEVLKSPEAPPLSVSRLPLLPSLRSSRCLLPSRGWLPHTPLSAWVPTHLPPSPLQLLCYRPWLQFPLKPPPSPSHPPPRHRHFAHLCSIRPPFKSKFCHRRG